MAGAIPPLEGDRLAGSAYGKAVASVGQTHLARRKEEVPPVARVSVFNSPFLVGFDHFERVLDRVSKAQTDAYPPYNIEQTGDNELRITLAVAGFTMSQLSVQVEDNQLAIRGKQDEDADRVFLHRGIATRQFYRNFVLAEGMEISGATLDNGLLHIDLRRQPLETRVQEIEIKNRAGQNSQGQTIDMRTDG